MVKKRSVQTDVAETGTLVLLAGISSYLIFFLGGRNYGTALLNTIEAIIFFTIGMFVLAYAIYKIIGTVYLLWLALSGLNMLLALLLANVCAIRQQISIILLLVAGALVIVLGTAFLLAAKINYPKVKMFGWYVLEFFIYWIVMYCLIAKTMDMSISA